MLEQAIADAATLREQALKNAEQSVIDRYSKQIKEAVEQMLEADEEESPMKKVDEVINEVEEEINEEKIGNIDNTNKSRKLKDTIYYDLDPTKIT